jgi:enoyl-CoA hydratase/carnithine racemase
VAAETVVVERQGPVLRVRMNRPDKLNAQDPTLIAEVDATFAAGAADVRVIVLSGQRMRRWRASSYRRLVATYRSSCARPGRG